MRSFDPETPSSSASSAVLRLLRPGPRATAALTAAVAAATALPLAAPQVTRRFVDDAIGGASIRHLTLVALGYLALAVAGQAARMVTAWLAGRLAWDGTNRLRERLTGHALGLDLAFHGRHTPGELIERVDGDVVAVADFVVAFLLDVVASVLLLAGVVVVVFAADWRIGGALLAYCLLIGYGMARAQRLAVPSAARSAPRAPRCSAPSKSASPAPRTSGPTARASTPCAASTRSPPPSSAPRTATPASAPRCSPAPRWPSPPARPSCWGWPRGPSRRARSRWAPPC
ncbi:ABC transporter transmembrane domain-containing protein [Nonomuraea thailandensis]